MNANPTTRPRRQDHPHRPPRVAVVDDDTAMREGLTLLLPEVEVVATCRSVGQLLATVGDPRDVDVVLLDLHLNGGPTVDGPQGRRAVALLSDAGYPVLIYTNERRRVVLAACYLAGARGLVHKTEPMANVSAAIEEVRSGRTVVTPAVAGLLDTIAKAGHVPALTERQKEVLHGRARGETFPAIGRRLNISPRTAEEYMGDVIAKVAELLTARNAAELQQQLGLGPGDLLE
jgi:DNA-binding NarL/FixJ family response regulator